HGRVNGAARGAQTAQARLGRGIDLKQLEHGAELKQERSNNGSGKPASVRFEGQIAFAEMISYFARIGAANETRRRMWRTKKTPQHAAVVEPPVVTPPPVLVRTPEQAFKASLIDRAHQQAAVAALGQAALVGTDLPTLLEQATIFVTQTLNVEYCSVWEITPAKQNLVLTASAGWRSGLNGVATTSATANSLAGYTMGSAEPVIIRDLRAITQFTVPDFFREHNVLSGISVSIAGAGGSIGTLEALTVRPRTFNEDDFHFLQSVANVIAGA